MHEIRDLTQGFTVSNVWRNVTRFNKEVSVKPVIHSSLKEVASYLRTATMTNKLNFNLFAEVNVKNETTGSEILVYVRNRIQVSKPSSDAKNFIRCLT